MLSYSVGCSVAKGHDSGWAVMAFDLVGRTGFEPVTSSVSGKRAETGSPNGDRVRDSRRDADGVDGGDVGDDGEVARGAAADVIHPGGERLLERGTRLAFGGDRVESPPRFPQAKRYRPIT